MFVNNNKDTTVSNVTTLTRKTQFVTDESDQQLTN